MNELPQFPEMIAQYGVVSPAALRMANPQPAMESNRKISIDLAQLARNKQQVSAHIFNSSIDKRAVQIDNFWDINRLTSPISEAFVPIQNGCDKFCTFCAVLHHSRSFPVPRTNSFRRLNRLSIGVQSIDPLGQKRKFLWSRQERWRED